MGKKEELCSVGKAKWMHSFLIYESNLQNTAFTNNTNAWIIGIIFID